MKQIDNVHVFTAGDTVDSNGHSQKYSVGDLKEIANSYDPQAHEAPIVWGHEADRNWGRHLQKATQLANGWIVGLRVVGKKLFADIEVDENTYVAVREKKLKKRSIAFYNPDSEHNPSPGKWYVRHLALLGTDPPAIKGLADISIFSEVYNTTILNETNMNKDEAILALDENAADWLAAILKDDGNGFNEDVVGFEPNPQEDNNWLWNDETKSYSGQLMDSSDNKYDFSITKEGDQWISSVKPILSETEMAEAEAETETEAESQELEQAETESQELAQKQKSKLN
jgi:hypothetical protein